MFQFLIQAMLTILVLIFNSIWLVLSWLPRIVAFLLGLAQTIVFVSYDLYRRFLTWTRPLGLRVGIDWMTNPWRLLACIGLSVVIGLVVIVVVGWAITLLGAGICVGHGLLVGVLWDQLGLPPGVRLGVH